MHGVVVDGYLYRLLVVQGIEVLDQQIMVKGVGVVVVDPFALLKGEVIACLVVTVFLDNRNGPVAQFCL